MRLAVVSPGGEVKEEVQEDSTLAGCWTHHDLSCP